MLVWRALTQVLALRYKRAQRRLLSGPCSSAEKLVLLYASSPALLAHLWALAVHRIVIYRAEYFKTAGDGRRSKNASGHPRLLLPRSSTKHP